MKEETMESYENTARIFRRTRRWVRFAVKRGLLDAAYFPDGVRSCGVKISSINRLLKQIESGLPPVAPLKVGE